MKSTDTSGGFDSPSDTDSPDTKAYKKAWARLLSKIYEIDPFVCPKCGSDMKVVAVIQDPDGIRRVLRHLDKQGRTPPD